MDICDNADRLIQQHLEASIEAIKVDDGLSPVYIDGVACCVDCESPIPLVRLQALPHCCRCIDCQEAYEEELANELA